MNRTMDQNSPTRFCRGVPERHHLAPETFKAKAA